MKILSFDIGIKNLAYCCFYVTSEKEFQIESWDIINLCEEKNYTCQSKCEMSSSRLQNWLAQEDRRMQASSPILDFTLSVYRC